MPFARFNHDHNEGYDPAPEMTDKEKKEFLEVAIRIDNRSPKETDDQSNREQTDFSQETYVAMQRALDNLGAKPRRPKER